MSWEFLIGLLLLALWSGRSQPANGGVVCFSNSATGFYGFLLPASWVGHDAVDWLVSACSDATAEDLAIEPNECRCRSVAP